jgi:D-alanyl-D-alanine carboxypeptidase/D-alanyl-D-alanine-endopeptidase (penicillin-binding protein 4)
MKKILSLIVLLPTISLANLQATINKQISTALPNEQVGVIVTNLQTGKVIYQHNANSLYTPASLLKLYTAMAALIKLGPNFRYQTQLMAAQNKINGHSLDSNLAYKFSYDPTLSAASIQSLVAALKTKNIDTINGNLYIGTPVDFEAPYPPGRVWDDLSYAYGAPISNIIINRNQWRLSLLPSKIGMQAELIPDPDLGVVKLINHTITTKTYRKDCPIRVYPYGPNSYVLLGCVPQNGVKQYLDLAYSDPAEAAQSIARDALKAAKIKINGKVLISSDPGYANEISYLDSAPLHEIINHMLHKSDNVYADSLPMTILINEKINLQPGASYWNSSIKAMQEILASTIGLDPTAVSIADGSGLSRYDLIAPVDLNKILIYGYQNQSIHNWWLSSLPTAGVNGTLKYRDILRPYQVHAKTGSMSGVEGLAGYMQNQRGQEYSFVIMINGLTKNRAKLHNVERDILRSVYTSN